MPSLLPAVVTSAKGGHVVPSQKPVSFQPQCAGAVDQPNRSATSVHPAEMWEVGGASGASFCQQRELRRNERHRGMAAAADDP